MKKSVLLLAGLALTAVLVFQVRALRTSPGDTLPVASGSPSAGPAGDVIAEGRLVPYPGAEVVVGTDFAGTLRRLAVRENQAVRQGQLIAEILADDLVAARDEARAAHQVAEADVRLYQAEVARAERLLAEQIGTPQALDRARRDVEAATARTLTTTAAVRRLEAELAKARIVAPIDGVVTARSANPGETVLEGDPLVTLVDLARTRIEAEVGEFDAGRVALGDAVEITAEGLTGRWHGTVEEIPDVVVGRRLKPQDPGRPTDTRVLLVKIALAGPTPLKLGQRIEARFPAPAPAGGESR